VKLILDKQIRLGRPHRVKGLAEATGGPAFAAAAGLLLYASEHADEMPRVKESANFALPVPFAMPFNDKIGGNFIGKVTHWLKENW
jgi:cell division protein FtsA